MKWFWGILVLAFFLMVEQKGLSQPLSVAVTAFSSSTGATIVATGPANTSVSLDRSDVMGGISIWTVVAALELDSNGSRQYQDTGAASAPQRYYRLRHALWLNANAVYSVNYAGFVRKTVGTGWTLLSNPLLSTSGTVAYRFRTPANGYSLFWLKAG